MYLVMKSSYYLRIALLSLSCSYILILCASSYAQSKSVEGVNSAALSLHFELPELGLTYENCLQYIKALGASHVAINIQVTMEHTDSSFLRLKGSEVTKIEDVKRVLSMAKTIGLKVIIFPIIWVENREIGEWRGTLKPQDQDRWWSAYESWIGDLAALAEMYQVDYFSIGSELSSLEGEEGRWRALIRRVKGIYKGRLTYSANWDHFEEVGFWDQLDVIGITAYYPLVQDGEKPTLDSMRERWLLIKAGLLDWLDHNFPKQRLLFTELGYPSQLGGATQPWHYLQSNQVDLNVQKEAFQAFREVWHTVPQLLGVNIWNLWGLGGPHDAWYTVRGKPAAAEVQKLFQQLNVISTDQSTPSIIKVNK